MKRYNYIIERFSEPEDKYVIWLKDSKLKYYSGGGWIDISSIVNVNKDDLLFEDDTLRLADRTSSPQDFIQNGYKILRRNIISGKNILTQKMISEENCTYEIRYNFDLNGSEITIPNNCSLKFNGGSISNGSINLSMTEIIASSKDHIFNNTLVKGSSTVGCYVDWFGAKRSNIPIEVVGNSVAIQRALDSGFKIIKFGVGFYYVDNTLTINSSKYITLEGVHSPSIVPLRSAVDTKLVQAFSGVLWTNKNIEVIATKVASSYIGNTSYDTEQLCITGGLIDVSLC